MKYGRTHIVGRWETLYALYLTLFGRAAWFFFFRGDGDNLQAMMIKGITRMETKIKKYFFFSMEKNETWRYFASDSLDLVNQHAFAESF